MSPSDPKIKETLERGSAANTRWRPKGKNKRLAIHGQGKLEARKTRARRLVRT